MTPFCESQSSLHYVLPSFKQARCKGYLSSCSYSRKGVIKALY
nr:MAG TPA: hypothetical protein [Caudoviricetes sp.]